MDSTLSKRCEHCQNTLEPAQAPKAPESRLVKGLLKLCEWLYAPQRHRLSSNDSRIVSQKASIEVHRNSPSVSNDAETINPVQDGEAKWTAHAVETRERAGTSSIAAASNDVASSTGLTASNLVTRSDDAKDSDMADAAGCKQSCKSVGSPTEMFQAHCTASSERTSLQPEPDVSKFSDSGNEHAPSNRGILKRFSLPQRNFSLRRRKVSSEPHSLRLESNITISNVITISMNGQSLERLPDEYLGNPRYFEGPVEMGPPWANVRAVSSQQRSSLGPRPSSSIYSQDEATDQSSPESTQNGTGRERRSRPRPLYLVTSLDSQADDDVGPSTPQVKNKAIDASLESPDDSGYGGSEASSSPIDRFQNGDSLKRLGGRACGLGDEGRNWLSWTQSDAYRSDILEAEFQQQREKIKQRLKTFSQDMGSRSRASLEMFRRHKEVLGKCYNDTKVKVSSRSLRGLQMATKNITNVSDRYTANPPIIAIQTPLPTAPRLNINWREQSVLLPADWIDEEEEEERLKPWWEREKKPVTGHVVHAHKMVKKSKPGDGVPIFKSDADGDVVECSRNSDLRVQALSDQTPPPGFPPLSVLPPSLPAKSPRRQLTLKDPSKAAAAGDNTTPLRAFRDRIPQKSKSILAKKSSSDIGKVLDQDPEFVHRMQSLQLEQLEKLMKKNVSNSGSEEHQPPPSASAQRRFSIPPIRGMNLKLRDSLEPTTLKPSLVEPSLSEPPRSVKPETLKPRTVQPKSSYRKLLRSASKANSCYRRDMWTSGTDEMKRKKNALRMMAVLRRSVAGEDGDDGGEDGEGEGLT